MRQTVRLAILLALCALLPPLSPQGQPPVTLSSEEEVAGRTVSLFGAASPGTRKLTPVERCCWNEEEFLGVKTFVPVPPETQIGLLAPLLKDPQWAGEAARKSAEAYRALGRFSDAEKMLVEYCRIQGRTPAALAVLADYYGDRLEIDRQIEVLFESAEKSPKIDVFSEQRRTKIYRDTEKAEAEEGGMEEGEPEEEGQTVASPGRAFSAAKPARLFQGATTRVHNDAGAVDVYRQIVSIATDHGRDSAILAAYQKLISFFPRNPAYRDDYIAFLIEKKRYREALRELDVFERLFPDQFVIAAQRRSAVYLALGMKDRAVAAYERLLRDRPDENLFCAYFDLLQSLGALSGYRKALLAKRAPTIDDTVARYFLTRYYGRHKEADEAVDRWVADNPKALDDDVCLEKLGVLYLSGQRTADACRVIYTLFLRNPTEENLSRLFYLVLRATDSTQFGADRLSDLFRKDFFDVSPGFAGAVLSLLLNDTGLRQKLRELEQVTTIYASRGIAYDLFLEFRKRFPKSALLPDIFSEVIETAFAYRDFDHAIAWAQDYLASFPCDEKALEVRRRVADAYEGKEEYEKAWETYQTILDLCAGSEALSAYYSSYLDAFVSSLTAQKEYLRAMGLYWNEIAKHPDNEELYEKLLAFLTGHDLYAEQLKLYQEALSHFRGPKWINRIARWYLIRRGDAQFQALTRQIRDTLNCEELEAYLREMPRLPGRWDSSGFLLEMMRYAHDRFPLNKHFAVSLLDLYHSLYEWGKRPAYEQPLVTLTKECYWLDEHIGRFLLTYLMFKDGLRAELERCANRRTVAYLRFLADGWEWLGHFEEALGCAQELADAYPGDEVLQRQCAALSRSLGRTDEAGERYERLARLLPARKDLWITAGEIWADAGKYEKAGSLWEEIVKIRPQDRELHRELATVYWDYYQYEKAVATIQRARRQFGKDDLFAKEMGILLEGLGNLPEAVSEYARVFAEDPFGNAGVRSRLVYLTRKKNLGKVVERAFASGLRGTHRQEYTLAFGQYLDVLGKRQEEARLYASAISQFTNLEYLDRLYRFFANAADREHIARVLERMAVVSREDSTYLRRLATFYEEQKNWKMADATVSRMIDKYRGEEEYCSILSFAKNYYERRGDAERVLWCLRETVASSKGEARDSALHELAATLVSRGKYAEAAAILEDLLRRHPSATGYFDTLASLRWAQGDFSAVVELYRQAIQSVQADASLTSDEKREAVADLRRQLIDKYCDRGMFREALDQHIEIVNRDPLNEEKLSAAFTLAREHDLLPVLLSYYSRTAETSFKDYRFQVVMARLCEMSGNLSAAQEWLRKAIVNEPQRTELHQALADLYLRTENYDQTILSLKNLWKLTRSTGYLYEIARVAGAAGNRNETEWAVAEIVATKPSTPEGWLKLAQLCVESGDYRRAYEFIPPALSLLKKDPYRYPLSPDAARTLVAAGVRAGKTDALLGVIDELNGIYGRELGREVNFQKDAIRDSLRVLQNAVTSTLADELEMFGCPQDLRSAEEWIQRRKEQYLLDLARRAHLKNAEEFLLKMLVNQRNYHVDALATFYTDRQAFADACALLRQEESASRDSWEKYECRRKLARAFLYLPEDPDRLVHSPHKEMAELELLYAYSNGILLEGDFPGTQSPEIGRFFSLSYALDNGCLSLTARPNTQAGALANYLIRRGNCSRAVETIDRAGARLRQVWRDTKKILILSFFRQEPDETERLFGRVLRAGPVSEQIHKPIDRATELIGNDWFLFCRRYGEFVEREKRQGNPEDYLYGEIEGAPLNAGRRIWLGDRYLKAGKYEKAIEEYSIAGALNAPANDVRERIGKAHLLSGRKDLALAEWDKMVSGKGAGVADHCRYIRLLWDEGLKEESFRHLKEYAGRLYPEKMNPSQLRELLSSLADRISRDDAGWIMLLKDLCRKDPSSVWLASYVIEKKLVPPQEEEFFYLFALGALSPKEDIGRFKKQADEWRKKLSAYYLAISAYGKALELIDSVERTLGKDEQLPQWAVFDRIAACLKTGEVSHSKKIARDYCVKNPESFEQVALLWKSLDREDLCLETLEEMYRRRLFSLNERTPANYYGLAEVCLKTGRKEQGATFLRQSVQARPLDREAFSSAAELAETHGLLDEALSCRTSLRKIAPADDANILALGQLLSQMGKKEEAARIFAGLVLSAPSNDSSMMQAASRRVRYEAACLLGETVSVSGARRLFPALFARTSESDSPYSVIARASLFFHAGQKQEAYAEMNGAIAAHAYNAEICLALGRFAEADGKINDAVKGYLGYLAWYPDDTGVRKKLVALFVARAESAAQPEFQYYQALHVAQPLLPPGFSAYWEDPLTQVPEPSATEHRGVASAADPSFLRTLAQIEAALGRYHAAAVAEKYLQQCPDIKEEELRMSRQRETQFRNLHEKMKKEQAGLLVITGDLANRQGWE